MIAMKGLKARLSQLIYFCYRHWQMIAVSILFYIGGSMVLYALYLRYENGYVWHKSTGFEGKTVWEWMELLIVPAVIAAGGYLFSRSERDKERETERDRHLDDTLNTYLDKIGRLIIEDDLLNLSDQEHDSVLKVAQILTITALRSLDVDRKNIVIQFLRDSGLAQFVLIGASLSDANLQWVDLSEVNLSKADLRLANLVHTSLHGVNLNGADLSGADLRLARIGEGLKFFAERRRIQPRAFILEGAILDGANLEGSELYDEYLKQAKSLRNTIMSDGIRYDGRFDTIESLNKND